MKVKVKSFRRVRLFATPWTAALQALHPWDSPGNNAGAGCHFLLQGIFLNQGSNPSLPPSRQTLYRVSYQGSPKHVEKHQLTLEQASMFWCFPNLFLQLQFLVFLTDIWGPSRKFHFFDSLVSKTQWVKLNLLFSLSNHICLLHPGTTTPSFSSARGNSRLSPSPVTLLVSPSRRLLSISFLFRLLSHTPGLESDNWITVTYLASSLKSLSHLGHWIHGAKSSCWVYHLVGKRPPRWPNSIIVLPYPTYSNWFPELSNMSSGWVTPKCATFPWVCTLTLPEHKTILFIYYMLTKYSVFPNGWLPVVPKLSNKSHWLSALLLNLCSSIHVPFLSLSSF